MDPRFLLCFVFLFGDPSVHCFQYLLAKSMTKHSNMSDSEMRLTRRVHGPTEMFLVHDPGTAM